MEEIIKMCEIHEGIGRTRHPSGYLRKCSKCNTAAVTKRRKKLKQMAVEYKGGKCERCGYSKSLVSLAFHHVDPTQKDFNMAEKGYTRSWESVKQELDKCILVCNNCHGEIHEEMNMDM